MQFAQRANEKGVHWVDAPVTGSKIGAENGQLIFIVGGQPEPVEYLDPLFKAMGKQVIHIGATGKGQAAKLGMNLMIALIYEGFAEGIHADAETRRRAAEADRADPGVDGQNWRDRLQGTVCAAP